MRNKRIVQRSIFDADFADHPIGDELAAMSDWLDQHPELLELAQSDLPHSKSEGRHAIATETVVRCGLLKQYRQASYRELEFLLHDSRSMQRFARVDPFNVPCKSALQRNISAIRAETWEAMHRCLLVSAKCANIEDGERVRLDSTVVDSPILSPTDSRLLLDGVRVMVRLLTQARDEIGAAIEFVNHQRVAKRRCRAIDSARGAARREPLYAELLHYVRRTLGYVDAAIPVVRSSPWLFGAGWIAETQHYRQLIERVIDQTERRVFKGESVPAADKLVSLFEPHTDIIRKGGRDTQYGHKLNLTSGRSGLVLDAVVESGNPADSARFQPMLRRHIECYGQAPRQMAADGGYADRKNLAAAKQLGVNDVVFHKKRGIEVEDMTSQRWLYRKLRSFRAGIEAGISYLKRSFGLSRCTWKGLSHFKAYVWSSIFAHNLVVLSRRLTI